MYAESYNTAQDLCHVLLLISKDYYVPPPANLSSDDIVAFDRRNLMLLDWSNPPWFRPQIR